MRDLLLIFTVAHRLYAIPARLVREIVFPAATTQVPGQPGVLDGFLDLRGDIVPVISLRALFQEPPGEPDIYAPVIVINTSGPLALVADEVMDVLEVSTGQRQAMAAGSSVNDCAEAQVQTEAGVAVILSAERLLLSQERRRIAELQSQVERRLAECEGHSR